MVLQLLAERGELTSQAGRSAFAVLLVQDIAVGPLLVVTLVLGSAPEAIAGALFWSVLKALAAVIGILAVGRWVVRPVYGPISEGGQIETFTALTLLIVLATGLATELAGLSMAFGAFLAGMLLADTRHRHQVAAVIQPFRGLLLGLFFMTVGMSIDAGGVIARAGALAAIVVGLLVAKTAVAAAVGAALGMPRGRAVYVGLLLAGSGEFGFVLLGAAVGRSLLEGPDAQLLGMAVTLSMAATPLLAFAGRRALPDIAQESGERVETAKPHSGHVVVAGFGRAGRECAAQLRAAGKLPVGIDVHAECWTRRTSKARPPSSWPSTTRSARSPSSASCDTSSPGCGSSRARMTSIGRRSCAVSAPIRSPSKCRVSRTSSSRPSQTIRPARRRIEGRDGGGCRPDRFGIDNAAARYPEESARWPFRKRR